MNDRADALMRALDRAADRGEAEIAARTERDELVADLVDVLDSFDRLLGIGAGDGPGSGTGRVLTADAGATVAAIARQLAATCRRAGLEPFGAVGDDAATTGFHVAGVRQGTEPGVVVEVLERGWCRDGRVIRSCRVIAAGERPDEGETR